MKAETLESQKDNPPREWVKLRETEEDSFSEGDFAKAFCSYVSRFYWRPRDDEPNELHVVFREDDEKDSRYRYFDVPRSVYEEFWRRAYFPEEHSRDIGTWFFQNVRNKYECDKFER